MTVINKKDVVYIGRPSYFGNPFVIGPDGNREEVYNKYLEYAIEKMETDPMFRERVRGVARENVDVLVCSTIMSWRYVSEVSGR